MVTVKEVAWEQRLRRALTCGGARPLLVLVEGAAGTGKSHLLRGLAELLEVCGAPSVMWVCGSGGPPSGIPDEGPVLLLVDDLHHASAAESDRLRKVLEGPRPGLAAVMAYRPEELASPGLPLGGVPVRYPAELVVLRHHIETWGFGQVSEAVAEAVGERGTPEAAARLLERSGGVAQVVVDLLAALRDTEGRCTAAEVDRAGVPVRLSELVLSRLAKLPEEHHAAVWAAAVLNEPVPGPELLAVAGLSGRVSRTALTGALAGGALVVNGEGRYVLPVPLAAVAVRDHLPWSVLEELHARAARVVGRRQPVDWMALVRHRRDAGQVKGWVRAVEQAAREATATGRHQEVIDLLEQALASPVVPQGARNRLAPVLARSAVVGLRSDQTVRVLSRLTEDETLPVAIRGELRLDLGLLLNNQVGRTDLGWRVLERAAKELSGERPDLAARAMAALAMPQWPTGSLDQHLSWLRCAEEAAEASGSEAAHVAVAGNRASLAMCCGDPQAWRMVERLPVDSSDRVVVQHAARGLCNAADAAVWLGHYEQAENLLAEGIELSTRSGGEYVARIGLSTRLLLEWNTGRWSGLVDRCEAFVSETSDMPVVSADARLVLGLHALAQSAWGRAAEWFEAGTATVTECTAAPLAAAASGGLIRLALARQDMVTAAAEAERAWERLTAKGVWVWAADLAPWAVEAMVRAGKTAEAQAMTAAYVAGIEDRDSPAASAGLQWTHAVLAEMQGAWEDAALHYRRAMVAFEQMRRPYSRAITAEAAARCELTTGNADLRTQGLAELAACVQAYTGLGAAWDAARARAELRIRQPSGKRSRGRPSYGDQLSPREREVGELATKGLTNREIADILHLSPRTVEQHIARAMQKTGIASRTALVDADEDTHSQGLRSGGE
ncbi:LuxR C-terminal-related transcriptional regulator [Streptomyces sp. NPDC058861]|uniref:helix-turn-helix transcriptional regulator n=1 Tax=Streptomyces sp. NPDC058861 TaxID=3346653 RepID=UPI00368E9DDE